MAKRARRDAVKERQVFKPKTYVVEIGENDYTIEPQPIKRIAGFDSAISGITDNVAEMGRRHFVVLYEGEGEEEKETERFGPFFQDEAEAELAKANGNPARIESDPFEFSIITQAIGYAPFAVLSLMIPDLAEEDCEELSLPEISWLVELLIEVNGLDWFRDAVKNWGGPLLDELGAALADWIRTATWQSSVEAITNTAVDSTS